MKGAVLHQETACAVCAVLCAHKSVVAMTIKLGK